MNEQMNSGHPFHVNNPAIQEAMREQLARAWREGHGLCRCIDADGFGMQHANPYGTPQTAAAATTDAEAQPVTHPVAPRRVLPKVAAAARFTWAVIAGIAADVAGTSPAAIAERRRNGEGAA